MTGIIWTYICCHLNFDLLVPMCLVSYTNFGIFVNLLIISSDLLSIPLKLLFHINSVSPLSRLSILYIHFYLPSISFIQPICLFRPHAPNRNPTHLIFAPTPFLNPTKPSFTPPPHTMVLHSGTPFSPLLSTS